MIGLITTFIAYFIAGTQIGFVDAIIAYDTYKKWGWFWSGESWKDLHDEKHNWFETLMNASINARHVCKWIALAMFILSTVLLAALPPVFAHWWTWLLVPVVIFAFYQAGFFLTFKKPVPAV